MSSKSITIHVFSFVPKLYEELLKKINSSYTVKYVPLSDICKKYEKIVQEKEIAQLQDAKILISDGILISQFLNKLPQIEWIHCTWAGVEGLVNAVKASDKPSFPITRFASNSFSQLISEYVITWIVNYERGFLKSYDYQKNKEWAHKDNIATYRSLRELTVGVLGVGQMGHEVVRVLNCFGSKVHSLGRSGNIGNDLQVEKHWTTPDMPKFLKNVDYIVNLLPSTDETKGLLGQQILKNAEKSPVFINVGRGNIISEKEIIESLNQGWLSAAILDVFEEEPLRQESPLWTHPKVFITPHSAAVSRADDVADSFLYNLDLYLEGKELPFQIDWDRGY